MKKILAALVMAGVAAAANASVLSIGNTGAAGANWSYSVNNSAFTAAQVVDTNAFPFPIWSADSATSSWISARSSYAGNLSDLQNTNYTFRTTFDLASGFDPKSLTLTGNWQADNIGVEILVNGVNNTQALLPGQDNGTGFKGSPVAFNLTSGFKAGVNTIDFVVHNSDGTTGNPTGFRAEFLPANVAAVPEPETYALMGLGLTGLLLARRRKKA